MTHHRTLTYSVLLASLLALSACNMSPMASNVSTLTARLSGANEVPPARSNGSGTLSANIDKKTSVLSWTVTYSGLSGPATAGHFHARWGQLFNFRKQKMINRPTQNCQHIQAR